MNDVLAPPTDLDWYVDYLSRWLPNSGVPLWSSVRFTETLRYGADGEPCGVGPIFSSEAYSARFTELCVRGWPWINLRAVGLLGGALLLSVEVPDREPDGSRWTSVNMSGPSERTSSRGGSLEGVLQLDKTTLLQATYEEAIAAAQFWTTRYGESVAVKQTNPSEWRLVFERPPQVSPPRPEAAALLSKPVHAETAPRAESEPATPWVPSFDQTDATRCPIYHWDIRDAEAAARICSAFYQETVTVQATGTGHWVLQLGPKARAERSAETCEVCHAYPCACDCPDSCRQ